MIPTSGWAGRTEEMQHGTATDTMATTGGAFMSPDFSYHFWDQSHLEVPPRYIPTKLDKQIQKQSFRAIQKQHERRCR